MELYQGLCQDFVHITTTNTISQKLTNAYYNHYGYHPSNNEILSWQNSLNQFREIIKKANLLEQGIKLEYFIPLTSLRIDVLLTGKNANDEDQAILVELKQWQKTYNSMFENEVKTYLGGGLRDILHPSVQVDAYKNYLEGFLEVFYTPKDRVKLDCCVFLHNYDSEINDPVLSEKFNHYIKSAPIYFKNDDDVISQYLSEKLCNGEGQSVLERINKSNIRPSKKLLKEASKIIKNNNEYVLIEEQKIVFDQVMGIINNGLSDKKKQVLIIKGGPGTGKSLIAINLLSELTRRQLWAEYVTGSAAFTQSYKRAIGNSNGASNLFKYTNNYVDVQNQLRDCLIIDEAHRIRDTAPQGSWSSKKYSGKVQIQEIIEATKVAVFFIDDNQVVLPDEVGNSEYIKEHALRLGCDVWEETLNVQFRCAGNEGFIKWIENTFEINQNQHVMFESNNQFDFKIMSSPKEIEDKLLEHIAEGYTARMVSGFCFKWTKSSIGALDVQIGDYKRPWNLKEAQNGSPAANLWAYDDRGFGQVGCVYSAQGFEFDYIGVIIGNDIIYDISQQKWIPIKENHKGNMIGTQRLNSMSDNDYLKIVKNIYRVLLSRGMKGCYVYFMDKGTEDFVKTRIRKLI